MRSTILISCISLCLLTGAGSPFGTPGAAAQTSVSFQVFYDQLSPYGDWVEYPNYGYVWVPAGRNGFRPYGTRGHWVYSEDGWTWVSDYSWGWAPFHYGNWFYDDSYGWMWSPGYQWAPAWVTWGEQGGNYCWAPIGPRVDIGVSFGSYRPPYQYWNFCPRDRITSVNVSHYYVNNVHNRTVINNITVINNVQRGGNGGGAYLRGPAPATVERFTHSHIHPVAIQTASRPGSASVQRGQLAIYRPTIRNYNAGVKPSSVKDLHALRPMEGGASTHPGQPHAQQPPHPNQGQPQQQQEHPLPGQPHAQEHSRPVPSQPHPLQGQQQPVQQQAHPMQQAQPHPQEHARPMQSQPRPQEQARPMPQQQSHPMQERPMPQQPRPQQQPMRQVPPPHAMQQQQPRPQPQPMNRPTEVAPPAQSGNPPHEHHR